MTSEIQTNLERTPAATDIPAFTEEILFPSPSKQNSFGKKDLDFNVPKMSAQVQTQIVVTVDASMCHKPQTHDAQTEFSISLGSHAT